MRWLMPAMTWRKAAPIMANRQILTGLGVDKRSGSGYIARHGDRLGWSAALVLCLVASIQPDFAKL